MLPPINIVTEVKHLTPNSFMVLRVDTSGMTQAEAQRHLDELRNAVGRAQSAGAFPAGTFVVLNHALSLEALPENEMNRVGWFRKEM